MKVFVARECDWDMDITIGAFESWVTLLGSLVNRYEGRIDFSQIEPPEVEESAYSPFPTTDIYVDGGYYGRRIIIEELEVE